MERYNADSDYPNKFSLALDDHITTLCDPGYIPSYLDSMYCVRCLTVTPLQIWTNCKRTAGQKATTITGVPNSRCNYNVDNVLLQNATKTQANNKDCWCFDTLCTETTGRFCTAKVNIDAVNTNRMSGTCRTTELSQWSHDTPHTRPLPLLPANYEWPKNNDLLTLKECVVGKTIPCDCPLTGGGSTICSYSTGFNCSNTGCSGSTVPNCEHTNGLKQNTNKCACGISQCTEATGRFCKNNTDSCGKVPWGAVGIQECGNRRSTFMFPTQRVGANISKTCIQVSGNGFGDKYQIDIRPDEVWLGNTAILSLHNWGNAAYNSVSVDEMLRIKPTDLLYGVLAPNTSPTLRTNYEYYGYKNGADTYPTWNPGHYPVYLEWVDAPSSGRVCDQSGRSNYYCPSPWYKSGTACDSGIDSDTQTCGLCPDGESVPVKQATQKTSCGSVVQRREVLQSIIDECFYKNTAACSESSECMSTPSDCTINYTHFNTVTCPPTASYEVSYECASYNSGTFNLAYDINYQVNTGNNDYDARSNTFMGRLDSMYNRNFDHELMTPAQLQQFSTSHSVEFEGNNDDLKSLVPSIIPSITDNMVRVISQYTATPKFVIKPGTNDDRCDYTLDNNNREVGIVMIRLQKQSIYTEKGYGIICDHFGNFLAKVDRNVPTTWRNDQDIGVENGSPTGKGYCWDGSVWLGKMDYTDVYGATNAYHCNGYAIGVGPFTAIPTVQPRDGCNTTLYDWSVPSNSEIGNCVTVAELAKIAITGDDAKDKLNTNNVVHNNTKYKLVMAQSHRKINPYSNASIIEQCQQSSVDWDYDNVLTPHIRTNKVRVLAVPYIEATNVFNTGASAFFRSCAYDVNKNSKTISTILTLNDRVGSWAILCKNNVRIAMQRRIKAELNSVPDEYAVDCYTNNAWTSVTGKTQRHEEFDCNNYRIIVGEMLAIAICQDFTTSHITESGGGGSLSWGDRNSTNSIYDFNCKSGYAPSGPAICGPNGAWNTTATCDQICLQDFTTDKIVTPGGA